MHLIERRDRVLRGERELADALLDQARRAFDQAGELAALLAMTPSSERWRDICRLCAGRTSPMDLGEVEARLDAWWPDEQRVLPHAWLAARPDRVALRRLARRIQIEPPCGLDDALSGPGLDHITLLDLRSPAPITARFLGSQCSGLTGLRTLRIHTAERVELTDGALDAAHLRALRHLEIRRSALSTESARALLEAPCLDTLESLALDQVGLTAELAGALVAERRLGALRELDLSRNSTGGQTFVDAMARARHLCNLRALNLVDAELRSAAELLELPHLQGLRTLDLSANHAGSCLLDPLRAPDVMPHLETLRVGWNHLGPDGLEPLLAHARPLRELDLADNQLDDAAIAHLADRARWPALRRLGLARNPLTDSGVAHLVRLRGVESLGELDLSATRISAHGLDWLCTDDLDADDAPFALTRLDVTKTGLDADAVLRLLASRRLARLRELRVPCQVARELDRGDPRVAIVQGLAPEEVPRTPARRRRATRRPRAPRRQVQPIVPTTPVRRPAQAVATPAPQPPRDPLGQLLAEADRRVAWGALVHIATRRARGEDDIEALVDRIDAAIAGWPDRLRVLPEHWVADAPSALSRLARTVALADADASLTALAPLGEGALPSITTLVFENQLAESLDAAFERLWQASSVHDVRFKRCHLLPDHAAELAERLPDLQHLALVQMRPSPELLAALTATPLPERLVELRIEGGRVTLAHIEALLARPWPSLTTLTLTLVDLDAACVRLLLESPALARLEYLDVHGAQEGAVREAVADVALADTRPHLSTLRCGLDALDDTPCLDATGRAVELER